MWREFCCSICRLGHVSFDSLSRLYPDMFKGVDKSRLVWDACEFGKHTRSIYPSISLHNCEPFILIHSDVWGPCSVTSVSSGGSTGYASWSTAYPANLWSSASSQCVTRAKLPPVTADWRTHPCGRAWWFPSRHIQLLAGALSPQAPMPRIMFLLSYMLFLFLWYHAPSSSSSSEICRSALRLPPD